MSKPFVANQSKIKTWRSCQQAGTFRYQEHLVKRVKARPLTFGGIVHELIEEDANARDPMKKLAKIEKERGKLFRAEVEELGDIIADARFIMTDYFDFWKDDELEYIRFQKRNAEHLFEVPIADGIVMKGKIDAYARAKKKRWLVEHKSWGKNLPNEDERWRNVQSPLYTRATEMMGWPAVDGVLWDYIKSKPPTAPQLLKNGRVSTRVIDTLPSKVISWWGEQESVHKEDLARLLDVANKNRKYYFARIYTPTRKAVADSVFADFVASAIDMRDNLGKRAVKNIGRHCSWCQYAPLCSTELRGGDVDEIKAKLYIHEKDEKRYEIEAE